MLYDNPLTELDDIPLWEGCRLRQSVCCFVVDGINPAAFGKELT
ncbi:hypothetical protein predicted by Glimmer/Critica [Acetobacter senegalensis]|uniref:Uncharacterized protein n=1 Tax=Acetobacter senegalensis TaxID=446692 RepID=A0A0U5ESF9_9PROT|nr:hypothetical protein [Acetobacter senegalensis]CEF40324.1 hypothetical protein predicted by Glimmer/Critica [Acetobacter senegalensis]